MFSEKYGRDVLFELLQFSARRGALAGLMLSETVTFLVAIVLAIATLNNVPVPSEKIETFFVAIFAVELYGHIIGVIPSIIVGTFVGAIIGFACGLLQERMTTKLSVVFTSFLIATLLLALGSIFLPWIFSFLPIYGGAALWLGARLYTKLTEFQATNQAADDITSKPPATIEWE